MQKRNFILLIVIIVLLIGGLFGWFYLFPPKSSTGNPATDSINFLADFIPFGGSGQNTSTDTTNTEDISGYTGEPVRSNQSNLSLKKVSTMPISGYGVFMKERFESYIPDETSAENPTPPKTDYYPFVRYIDKSTGNTYQTFADEIEERQFSSAIIPTIYEAVWGNNGESVFVRYLKDDGKSIETFLGKLPKEVLGGDAATVGGFDGSFFPENIQAVSISPDGSKAFYISQNANGSTGTVFNFNTSSKQQIFSSSFSEWLPAWSSSNKITLTTKPSYATLGFSYVLNPNTESFSKLLSGINGLTTLMSPDGQKVLYADNNLYLYLYDLEANTKNLLGIRTLPEKCAWSYSSDSIYCGVPQYINGSQYPDSWYQGVTSFTDDLWRVSVATGNTTFLGSPYSIAGESIDIEKISIDENEDYLFFINKKNSYLWEFEL